MSRYSKGDNPVFEQLYASMDTIAPAGPPRTYFGIAECLMPGVKALAAASPVPGVALAFLCAHVLECLLKAYLSRGGSDERMKQRDIRHNLNALWALASAEGLPIPQPQPAWVDRLSNLHKPPYYLRYSTCAHGLVSPEPEPMTSELTALVELVRQQPR